MVHVPRRLRRKVVKIEQELAEQGVDVEFDVRVRRKAKNGGGLPVWETLGHVWLVFNIAKTAIGAWPKIRKILMNAGLTNDEIITLGLSRFTRPPQKKKKRKARRKTRDDRSD
jgi:hypothetical protein